MLQLAAALVRVLGPCRVLLADAPDDHLLRELLLLGCDAWAAGPGAAGPGEDGTGPRLLRGGTPGAPPPDGFDAVVLDADGPPIASRLADPPPADVLALLGPPVARAHAEEALLGRGWRRHPGQVSAGHPGEPAVPTFLRRDRRPAQPPGGLSRGGPEGDAFLARHAFAARFVRPGDRVLVWSDDADGAEVLATRSRASAVLTARPAQPDLLREVGDLDLVIALELDPAQAALGEQLDAFAGVVKLDGRLLAGLADGGGWPALADALRARFILEARHVQSPPPAAPAPRSWPELRPAPLDDPPTGGRVLALASANPLGAEAHRARYRHPAFDRGGALRPAVTDIAGGYDNPFLYRVMVQMGERLVDDAQLARLAEVVIDTAREDSADRGAAIAVLGYRVLEHRAVQASGEVLALIAAYEAATAGGTAPHVVRWRVSLAFLAGRLHELAGDRSAAAAAYRRASGDGWKGFSPLLATKAVAAAFFEGRLHLADRDAAAARAAFRRGLETALEAARAPASDFIGEPDHPVPFGLQEMAEVMDMGGQCATALDALPLWERDPGLFWRQVDVRRFGLASWARDLERENARLRGAEA